MNKSVSFFFDFNLVLSLINFLTLSFVKIIFFEKSVYKSNPLFDL